MRLIKKLFSACITIKDMIASQGLFKFIHKAVIRTFWYLYYNLFKRAEFKFNNHRYKYFYGFFNVTFTNERAVEIPIALDFLKMSLNKNILEVGNVLDWYFEFKHDVVDKYEKGQGVINQDISEYQTKKRYDLIISVSTLEHVGWDEVPRENNKLLKAIENMKNLLADKGEMLITMPFGYNDELDTLIKEGRLNFSQVNFLKRISRDNRWKEAEFNEIKDIKYGVPYPYANAIVIGRIRK